MTVYNEYVNFVLTGDEKYIMPLSVVMTSILVNLSSDRVARFFLFTTGFNDNDLQKINEIKKLKKCEIINIPMEEYKHYFEKIDPSKFKLSYVSLVCYYRLLMLKILPEDVEKCFYVDGDMIVDTDLSDIYDNIGNNLASVVVEAFAMNNKREILSHCFKLDAFKNFQKDSSGHPYFNAGFMLLNIKKCKEYKLFEKALKFLDENPNPPYADQDTLNAIIGQQYTKHITFLSPKYNVFCDLGINHVVWKKDAYYAVNEIKESLKNPKIFHYAGGHKPWLDYEQNHNAKWWEYCEMSPWKDLKKPPKPLKEIILKYYLFNVFDIFQFSKKMVNNTTIFKIKIFKILPLVKIKIKENKYSVRLFNIVPLISKKRIKYS